MVMSRLLALFLLITAAASSSDTKENDQSCLLQSSHELVAGQLAIQHDFLNMHYLHVFNHSIIEAINSDCNFYEKGDYGMKVDDKCCDLSSWPEGVASLTSPASRTKPGNGFKTWTCYVQDRGPPHQGEYVRNFLGCVDGKLEAAEACVPAGVTMGDGYPMNKTLAMSSFEDGTPTSCGCGQIALVGEGCFVSLTGYMVLNAPDPMASFVKISGNCSRAD
eukprot:TRINITY_DN676_c1_g7_i1.p1 TRINITY_DN676_c1_g7~~TRINITY_DN676_c1_g7_i1.p1  ORF type:complete len:220 (+),score=25.37 TRINITY_DN676_c1_g7_i1:111-770(+)